MSQLALEVAINLSPGTISRIENGIINPNKETILKIAKALNLNGVETASLFGIQIEISDDNSTHFPNKFIHF